MAYDLNTLIAARLMVLQERIAFPKNREETNWNMALYHAVINIEREIKNIDGNWSPASPLTDFDDFEMTNISASSIG